MKLSLTFFKFLIGVRSITKTMMNCIIFLKHYFPSKKYFCHINRKCTSSNSRLSNRVHSSSRVVLVRKMFVILQVSSKLLTPIKKNLRIFDNFYIVLRIIYGEAIAIARRQFSCIYQVLNKLYLHKTEEKKSKSKKCQIPK